MRDILYILFRHKLMMTTVFLVIVGIVTAFAYLSTPKYETVATVVLKSRHEDLGVFSTGGSSGPSFFPVTKEDINTAIQIFMSREVLEKTVKELSLHTFEPPEEEKSAFEEFFDKMSKKLGEVMVALDLKTPLKPFDSSVKKLGETLVAEPSPLANAITLSLKGEYPALIRRVLNKHLDSFLSHYISVYEIEEGEEFFKSERNAFKDKLEALEDEAAAFLKKAGVTDFGGEISGNNELRRTLMTRRSTADLGIRELEETIQAIETALSRDKIVLNREMRQVPSIRDLSEQLVNVESEKARLLTIHKPESEKIKNNDRVLGATESQLRQAVVDLLEADKADLAVMKMQVVALIEEEEALAAKNSDLKDLQKNYDRLIREQQQANEGFNLYSDKYEEARTNTQRNLKRICNVSIADRASKCVEPVFPNKLFLIILSIILGMFCSIGSAFLMDFLDNSLVKPEDVKRILEMDVLTSFPKVRN